MGWSCSERIEVREEFVHYSFEEFVSVCRVMVKMRNLLNQNAWYWDDAKFVNRSYIIKVR